MTTTIKHAFTDPKADGVDTTVARPSDWNADHVVTSLDTSLPNLLPNSDFGRRTVFGLAMPELFGDASAWSSASALSVASNQLTVVTASRVAKWIGPNTMWRDGRWSAQFKAVSATGGFMLSKDVDTNDAKTTGSDVEVYTPSGTSLALVKQIAGVRTTVASIAITLTLNNWYWLELEAQGTTYIAKIYSSGASPVAKGSATLVNTVSGTIADAAVTSGMISVWSDQANSLWGGIAASPGGVYIETWLPESFTFLFSGTLGGQAVGYDEATDAGPVGKQWALRGYIPAASRTVEFFTVVATGFSVIPSVAYAFSAYFKTSGKGGSGNLVETRFNNADQAGGNPAVGATLADAAETSWTRKTGTATLASTARRGYIDGYFNQGGTATGTAWVDLYQYEQGSAVTAWRNAPADDAPIVWKLFTLGLPAATTSTSAVEMDSRDLAANLFLPWDAMVNAVAHSSVANTGVGNIQRGQIWADGANVDDAAADAAYSYCQVAGSPLPQPYAATVRLAAGKHRIAMRWYTSAGTLSHAGGMLPRFTITAYRGR